MRAGTRRRDSADSRCRNSDVARVRVDTRRRGRATRRRQGRRAQCLGHREVQQVQPLQVPPQHQLAPAPRARRAGTRTPGRPHTFRGRRRRSAALLALRVARPLALLISEALDVRAPPRRRGLRLRAEPVGRSTRRVPGDAVASVLPGRQAARPYGLGRGVPQLGGGFYSARSGRRWRSWSTVSSRLWTASLQSAHSLCPHAVHSHCGANSSHTWLGSATLRSAAGQAPGGNSGRQSAHRARVRGKVIWRCGDV